MRKRQRTGVDVHGGGSGVDQSLPVPQAVGDDAFITDHDAVDSAGDDDDDDEGKPKSEKKAGRRKIKIEFIQDKSRRHITFSKRKAGIMKKAYELSTLTGTQVLLLVVSETGLVYTFTTAKLQPLVTQPEGKNLIQACLNAPHGSLPSSMPVGAPLGRASGPAMSMATNANMPGGLSIGQSSVVKDDEDGEDEEASHGGRANSGDKRRRRASSTAGGGATSPHSPNAAIPPPLSIPQGTSGPPSAQPHPASANSSSQPQMQLGTSPTSPQQQHAQIPSGSGQYSPTSYGHGAHSSQGQHQHHQSQGDTSPMYGGPTAHMMPNPPYNYPANQGNQQQLGGLANAAAQHGHWGPQPQQQVPQAQHYTRR